MATDEGDRDDGREAGEKGAAWRPSKASCRGDLLRKEGRAEWPVMLRAKIPKLRGSDAPITWCAGGSFETSCNCQSTKEMEGGREGLQGYGD